MLRCVDTSKPWILKLVAEPKTSKSDHKLVGCLLGCCALVVLFVAVVASISYYTLKYGVLAASPRVDTRAHVGEQPALLLYFDAEAPTAFSPAMLEGANPSSYNGALIKMFLPYEGSIALSAGPGATQAQFDAAISTRRGASFITSMVTDQLSQSSVPGMAPALQIQDDGGLSTVRGALPLPSEAPVLRGEAWPASIETTAAKLEGKHFVEFALDNRNGDASLAVAALVQSMGGDGALEADLLAGTEPGAGQALSLLSQVRIIKGLWMIKTARAALDFTPRGDLDAVFTVNAANEVAAMLLMGAAGRLPEELQEELADTGVVVTGSVEREGAVIRGTIHYAGLAEAMGNAMAAYDKNPESGFPLFMPPAAQ